MLLCCLVVIMKLYSRQDNEMTIDDYEQFCELWMTTHETMAGGKTLSAAAIEMVFEDLEDFPFEVVKQAVRKYRKTSQFAPTTFNIIEIIKRDNGLSHLGAEQAWAIAQGFFDESHTVIATQEIMSAWCVASEVDKYSAAKVFKETYGSIVNPESIPVWTVYHGSKRIGSDGRPEAAVLFNPTEKIRLPSSEVKSLEARMMLSAPPETTVAALLENPKVKSNVVDFKSGIDRLRGALHGRQILLEKSKSLLAKRHEKWIRKVFDYKARELGDVANEQAKCVIYP